MNLATHHTSTQDHTGLVPEIHIRNIALPVVFCRVFLIVQVNEVAVILKDVTFLLHLYLVWACRDIDGKGTLVVGLHTLLLVVVEWLPIKFELSARYRNAGAIIEHLACKHVIFT